MVGRQAFAFGKVTIRGRTVQLRGCKLYSLQKKKTMLPQVWILKFSRLQTHHVCCSFFSFPKKILTKKNKKNEGKTPSVQSSPEFQIDSCLPKISIKRWSGKSRLPTKSDLTKYPDPSRHSYFEKPTDPAKTRFKLTRFYWRVRWSGDPFWNWIKSKNGSLWCSSEPLNKSPRNRRIGPSFSAAIGIDASKTHLRCDQQAYLNKKQRQVQKSGNKHPDVTKIQVFFCDVTFVRSISSPKKIDSKIASMIWRI